MNEQKEKINSLSKVICIFCKITKVCIIIAMILIAMAIGVTLLSLGQTEGIWTSVSNILSEDYIINGSLNVFYAVLEFTNALISGVILYLLTDSTLNLFESIENSHTPFDIKNINIIKKIANIMKILVIVPPVLSISIATIFQTTATINFNFSMILVVIVFYCLSEIFAYGAKLQKDADETL
ncbi:hypothetical protein [Anaerofustis stercorihominis]|uniref:DUF2975 domain-containing protein n=2 Tax=Anaerofustis stercorihominis TaxID=214853 RepID=B1C656_9FIRM|nr:hypothetical protein [Anaerofustis stercorihominis]EDS73341.1 hypothetical protein ANASTE_00196 [Anaerofustis stercorihominis DSM 17244]MCQ4794791.1 hypothetical protein [Anaerofustis stercorihominis]RGD75624.1 hypothetical protein DW687_04685 [Anaerofustis stercorihominis]